MTTRTVKKKTPPAAEARPDTSPEAIARRRDIHSRSMADSALENCFPNPGYSHIHERWTLGELTSEESIALLKEQLIKENGP